MFDRSLVGKAWEDDSDLHMLVHVIPHLGSNKTLKTYLLKFNWKKWIESDRGSRHFGNDSPNRIIPTSE